MLRTSLNSVSSIRHAAEVFESVASQHVARFDRQRLQKLFAGAIDHALGKIGAAQIEMRKVPRIISFCGDCSLEPGNGFVKRLEADQIGADVVAGISKIR